MIQVNIIRIVSIAIDFLGIKKPEKNSKTSVEKIEVGALFRYLQGK
jgi:hypothetical protein